MSHGISTSTAAFAAKLALYDAAKVALAGDTKVDVTLGMRWPIKARDYFSVLGGQAEVDPATIVPRRGYDEAITLDVEVGSFTPLQGDRGERVAQQRAFALLTAVQDHIRVDDIQLGGTVQWCVPGDLEWDGATGDAEAGFGRHCAIAATFKCLHLIRNV